MKVILYIVTFAITVYVYLSLSLAEFDYLPNFYYMILKDTAVIVLVACLSYYIGKAIINKIIKI